MNKKENPHTFRYRGFPYWSTANATSSVCREARLVLAAVGARVVVVDRLLQLLNSPGAVDVGFELRALKDPDHISDLVVQFLIGLVLVHDTNLCCLCS